MQGRAAETKNKTKRHAVCCSKKNYDYNGERGWSASRESATKTSSFESPATLSGGAGAEYWRVILKEVWHSWLTACASARCQGCACGSERVLSPDKSASSLTNLAPTHPHLSLLHTPSPCPYINTRALSHARARTFYPSLPVHPGRIPSLSRKMERAYLPGCSLQAGAQDRLQLWGRELANQHSGVLLVSSSADHSEAEPRRGEKKKRAMFSYTNQWDWGETPLPNPWRVRSSYKSLSLTPEGPEEVSPLHVFSIHSRRTPFPPSTPLLKLSGPFFSLLLKLLISWIHNFVLWAEIVTQTGRREKSSSHRGCRSTSGFSESISKVFMQENKRKKSK